LASGLASSRGGLLLFQHHQQKELTMNTLNETENEKAALEPKAAPYAKPDYPQLLAGYIPEEEYARQRSVTLRTCQRDRALRQAPPYVVIGRQIYYNVESLRNWLQKRERTEERTPQSFSRRRA
jgi:hypothetical protein